MAASPVSRGCKNTTGTGTGIGGDGVHDTSNGRFRAEHHHSNLGTFDIAVDTGAAYTEHVHSLTLDKALGKRVTEAAGMALHLVQEGRLGGHQSTTGYLGVSELSNGRFQAVFCHGTFVTAVEAAIAYAKHVQSLEAPAHSHGSTSVGDDHENVEAEAHSNDVVCEEEMEQGTKGVRHPHLAPFNGQPVLPLTAAKCAPFNGQPVLPPDADEVDGEVESLGERRTSAQELRPTPPPAPPPTPQQLLMQTTRMQRRRRIARHPEVASAKDASSYVGSNLGWAYGVGGLQRHPMGILPAYSTHSLPFLPGLGVPYLLPSATLPGARPYTDMELGRPGGQSVVLTSIAAHPEANQLRLDEAAQRVVAGTQPTSLSPEGDPVAANKIDDYGTAGELAGDVDDMRVAWV